MKRLCNIIKSILFVAGDAVEESFIIDKLEVTRKQYNEAVSELMTEFSGDNGLHLLHFNKKLQLATNPQYASEVESVLNPIRERELTNTLLETLAICAYKQPITRLEIEEIRGVDCTYSVQCLLRLNLIESVGRKDAIGKPNLFATTDDFLKRFNLSKVEDLPEYEDFIDKLNNLPIFDSADVQEVEKPMFETKEIPDHLDGEDVDIID